MSRPVRYSNALVAIFLVALNCDAGNRAQPSTISNSSQFSSETHLYTYRYSLTNPPGSQAPLDTLVIKLEPGVDVVTNFRAPPGWRAFHAPEKGTVMWAATGFANPAGEDLAGNVPPSDYAIGPGATLSGFSFDSFSPPGAGKAISQSYVPIYLPPSEEQFEALETDRTVSTLPEDNGYELATTVPVPDADWTGNRRPSVDGFLVFANVQDKATFRGKALIVLRLGSAGEKVNAESLRVLLNSGDVTGEFVWEDRYKGYAATFDLESTPLKTGANVLRTSVEGLVPGTTDHRATDTDRLTFDFSPN